MRAVYVFAMPDGSTLRLRRTGYKFPQPEQRERGQFINGGFGRTDAEADDDLASVLQSLADRYRVSKAW